MGNYYFSLGFLFYFYMLTFVENSPLKENVIDVDNCIHFEVFSIFLTYILYTDSTTTMAGYISSKFAG